MNFTHLLCPLFPPLQPLLGLPCFVCLRICRSSKTGFAPMKLVPGSGQIFLGQPVTDVLIGHQKTFCQQGLYQLGEDRSTGSLWSSR